MEMTKQYLDGLLSPAPSTPLYHYTSQDGLIGIIGSEEIWATHIQYMNDSKELLHAMDLVREEIDARLEKDVGNYTAYAHMRSALDGIEGINICVASFSEDGDSLSQWRAYGSGRSNYTIGFDPDHISAVAGTSQWRLAPCIYTEEEQRRLASAIVDRAYERYLRDGPPSAFDIVEEVAPGGGIAFLLFTYGPLMKHMAFKDEREWRLISRPMSCKRAGFSFRPGSSTLVPYFALPLINSNSEFRIRSVKVGPTPNPALALRAIQNFLASKGLDPQVVSATAVPYRSW